MSISESTALDQVIVGWEYIYLQDEKVKKQNVLIITCFIS